MRIIDVNGKKRDVESIKKMVHQVPDKDGNMIDEEYAEAVINGRYRKGTWKEWYPLEKFKEMNPKVKI